ncbi:MAG: D-alanine--D-alanine ligase [Candidatus Sericytochromatia bacterium]|nr:D-alanine--D-alanine ligase [Candidatus Sericytochromatia bacterium]
MGKLRVAVLMGGPSSEREVSLRSGQMVLKNLDPERYEAFAVELNDLLAAPVVIAGLADRADFVFLALHGRWGEDGTVQGLLEVLGLPYQGSGVMASALAMNKVRSKAVYQELGLPQARWLDWRRVDDGQYVRGCSALHGDTPLVPISADEVASRTIAVLGTDLVLKGATQGSTLGLAMVDRPEAFTTGLGAVAAVDEEVLVEERIRGLELTAGVLGETPPLALPLIEILPRSSDTFDYEAKYTPGATDEICPARLDEAITATVQELARRAHHGLGCAGYSRSDFMLRDGIAYILETNTLPGLTEGSLLPQAARVAGIMMPDLLDRLVRSGLALRGLPSQGQRRPVQG